MFSATFFVDKTIFENHCSYILLRIEPKDVNSEETQKLPIQPINFPHFLTRFLYHNFKGMLFSVLPIDSDVLAIHAFSMNQKQNPFIPVSSFLEKLQKINLNFPFIFSSVQDLSNERKFNHDIIVIRQCIESKIKYIFEIENWFQVKDDNNEKILLNLNKSYSISNLTIQTEFNEDNKIILNSSEEKKKCLSSLKKQKSAISFQSGKICLFQQANQLQMKYNDKEKLTVTLTGTMKKKKLIFLSFSEKDKTKKRFEAKPCFCFPNFTPLYVHQLQERKDTLLNDYWFYVHGIIIKVNGMDAFCSFDADDDHAFFKYPEECLLESRLIDIPIHDINELNSYKNEIDLFIHRQFKF